jgi:hypothetical protein
MSGHRSFAETIVGAVDENNVTSLNTLTDPQVTLLHLKFF